MNKVFHCCIGFLLFFTLFPASPQEYDENQDGKIDKWIRTDSTGGRIIEIDRDYNGIADYAVVYDRDANLIEERLDFNNDGEMDDFYYYSNSVLQRREIDSNYDGKIDIWVYLEEGIYIQKFERDLDFDGTIDLVKDYDK